MHKQPFNSVAKIKQAVAALGRRAHWPQSRPRRAMKINRRFVLFEALLLAATIALTSATQQLRADTGNCNGQTVTLPFTDVQGNAFFCAIALAYFSGLTNGTSATTYSPTAPVPREQMAAFVGRTLDQSLKRGSRRAALGQWWTSRNPAAHRKTTVGNVPYFLASDGEHVYVSNNLSGTFTKVRASNGEVITDVTAGMASPQSILVAAGYIFIVGTRTGGTSYLTRWSSDLLSSASNLLSGTNPVGLTFDGENIWTANEGNGGTGGSLTRLNLSTYVQTEFTSGFNFTSPQGILYDGASLWVTVPSADRVRRVNPTTGATEQNIPVGDYPHHPAFDGTNLWVPCRSSHEVYVIRAVGGLQGTVLATLTGNGLNGPVQAAFDGERILVTNNSGDSVSLWKASDLTPLGTFPLLPASLPYGVCSDGTKFWISLPGSNQIVSF